MNELDQRIRDALQKEDSELLEHFRGEQSIHEMVLDTFRGRHRWLVFLTIFMTSIATVLMFIMFYKIFQAETAKEMVGWTIGFIFCTAFIAMMKVWYWMELNKNTITREIKRLELQLANLSRKIHRSGGETTS